MKADIDTNSLPEGYAEWRNKIENRIEKAKINAAFHVNTDMLSLYWSIGRDIILKKKELGWGAQVIEQLSVDLTHKFPEDKGYSIRNLHYMRRFAEHYPDFPILQVPLAEFKNLPISHTALAEFESGNDNVDIPLTTISWYHHISMLPKIKKMLNVLSTSLKQHATVGVEMLCWLRLTVGI